MTVDCSAGLGRPGVAGFVLLGRQMETESRTTGWATGVGEMKRSERREGLAWARQNKNAAFTACQVRFSLIRKVLDNSFQFAIEAPTTPVPGQQNRWCAPHRSRLLSHACPPTNLRTRPRRQAGSTQQRQWTFSSLRSPRRSQKDRPSPIPLATKSTSTPPSGVCTMAPDEFVAPEPTTSMRRASADQYASHRRTDPIAASSPSTLQPTDQPFRWHETPSRNCGR